MGARGSALLFGLLHGVNAFFGQSTGTTIQQIVFAAVFGVVYYTVRRGTGGPVVAMILHALWDGALFVNDHSQADPSPVATLFMVIALVRTVIALRHQSKQVATGEVVAAA